MKIYILLIVNLPSFIYVNVGEATEPLVITINKDGFGKNILQLPFMDIPTHSDTNIIRACPAEISSDQQYIRKLTTKFYKYGYCLFHKDFNATQVATCTEEVKPTLSVLIDEQTKKPIRCGPKRRYKLYEFGFYYCGELDSIRRLQNWEILKNLRTFRLNANFFPIYELCIDTITGYAIWTKHRIMTPAIFLNLNNAEKLIHEDDPKISIDALIFNEERYKMKLENYNTQGNENIIMEKMFMVPKEHIALKMWRKTANHYVVVSPLWKDLKIIMDEFNEAIKKLALQMYRNENILTIYTKIQFLSRKNNVETAWYRLLYEEKFKLAMLVIIQNTPDPHVYRTRLCDTIIHCDMQSWFAKQGDQEIQVKLRHAFCCYTNTAEVQRLFNIYLHIAGHWDIDQEFRKMNQQQLINQENEMIYPPHNRWQSYEHSQEPAELNPSAPAISHNQENEMIYPPHNRWQSYEHSQEPAELNPSAAAISHNQKNEMIYPPDNGLQFYEHSQEPAKLNPSAPAISDSVLYPNSFGCELLRDQMQHKNP